MEKRSGIIYHLESNSCAAQTVQFSFAITTKRNEGAALSGLIMISRIMVVWKGKERRMSVFRHENWADFGEAYYHLMTYD